MRDGDAAIAKETEEDLSLAKRSEERRCSIVAHRAANFEDAEAWDLEFWQSQSPQMRLSALVAMHREAAAIEAARCEGTTSPPERDK